MAETAQHTEIFYGDGDDPEEFARIGEVISFNGPSLSAEAIDITDLDNAAKRFLCDGTEDSGEISLDILFDEDDTAHAAIVALAKSGAVTHFLVAFSDPTAVTDFDFDPADVDVGGDHIAEVAHGLLTGYPVSITTTDTMPSPLVSGHRYYALDDIDYDNFELSETNALAIVGTPINLTSQGVGVHTLKHPLYYTFSAIVTGAAPTGAVADKITGTLTLKLTGAVTSA